MFLASRVTRDRLDVFDNLPDGTKPMLWAAFDKARRVSGPQHEVGGDLNDDQATCLPAHANKAVSAFRQPFVQSFKGLPGVLPHGRRQDFGNDRPLRLDARRLDGIELHLSLVEWNERPARLAGRIAGAIGDVNVDLIGRTRRRAQLFTDL